MDQIEMNLGQLNSSRVQDRNHAVGRNMCQNFWGTTDILNHQTLAIHFYKPRLCGKVFHEKPGQVLEAKATGSPNMKTESWIYRELGMATSVWILPAHSLRIHQIHFQIRNWTKKTKRLTLPATFVNIPF